MLALFVGFFWGLMEALWFFIVPDVALSYFAIKGWRPALIATGATVFGSMVGALVLFVIYRSMPEAFEATRSVWSHLPGYYPKMFEVAREHLEQSGAMGLLSGPNSGIPYRFYVFEALLAKISIANIWFWTPIARLERILIAPVVVLALRGLLNWSVTKWWPRFHPYISRVLVVVISVYWLGLYVWYWGLFLPAQYGG